MLLLLLILLLLLLLLLLIQHYYSYYSSYYYYYYYYYDTCTIKAKYMKGKIWKNIEEKFEQNPNTLCACRLSKGHISTRARAHMALVTRAPSYVSYIQYSPVMSILHLEFVLILELTKTLEIPPLPQRDWIWSSYVNNVSRTCAYSSHQVSSWSFISKHFPRFPVSKISISPSTPQCPQIQSEWKMNHLRHDIFPYIKFY